MISDNIKALRKQRRITQAELADALGVSKSTISMYENGNRVPPLEIIEAIADYFNVDLNQVASSKELPRNAIENNIQILFESLSSENKEKVKEFMEFLLSKE